MPTILEMRVAITTEIYDRLVDFYQNALGLDPAALWATEHSRAALFELGRGHSRSSIRRTLKRSIYLKSAR